MFEASSAPRNFQPVEALEAKNFIWEAAKTFASTMIWTREQRHTINTHLTVFNQTDQEIFAWIPQNFDAAGFMADLAKINQKECYFSISLGRANIFFRTQFLEYDEGGLKFKAPEKVFKVQRRKDNRFPIPDGHVLKIEFQDPLFPESRMIKKVIDLSASGLAFCIENHEASFFVNYTVIKDLLMTISGTKIKCNAEIRHIKAIPSGQRISGTKVGIRFLNISNSDIQTIAAFVFEESRKFYSKYL